MKLKYIYTLFISLVLFSCQDKELSKLENNENYVAPEFVTVPENKLYVFTEEEKEDTFATVEWTPADYGNVQAEYKYNVIAEIEGFENSAIVTSVTRSSTLVDITVVDMNAAVNKITGITNAGGIKEESVSLRVEAFIGDHSDNVTNTSTENTNFSVQPYFVIESPETLFVIGDGIGGWDWDANSIQLVPVHSHPEKFWAVLYLEAGKGIKFSPEKAWNGADFGSDGEGNGELGARDFGGDNIKTPTETGYYMVVVDYGKEQVLIVEPEVYLIGDCIGSWNSYNPDALMDVDNANMLITTTKDLNEGELRMYVGAVYEGANWLGDWWQSEFIILNGELVFRGTGDDQERVKLNGGTTTINLNFQLGEGEIK